MLVHISPDIINLAQLQHSLQFIDCIKLLQYLYDHYIDEQSMISVNISGGVRRKIVKAFTKHNLMENTNGTSKNNSKPKTRKDILPLVIIHDDYNEQIMTTITSKTPSDDNDKKEIPNKDMQLSPVSSSASPSADSSTLYTVDHNISILITDIMQGFEYATTELYGLLYRDSWPRFRNTAQYIQFQQEHNHE